VELPTSPFATHPTVLELQAEGLNPTEVRARLRAPGMRERLLAERPADIPSAPQDAASQGGSFEDVASKLKVLRGDRGEYEVARPEHSVAAQAARAGQTVYEFAYDELVLKGSIFNQEIGYTGDDSLEAYRTALLHPQARFGLGDAGAHITRIMDACYTTFLLTHFVRDRADCGAGETIPLETAVRKLTADNAELYNLRDRGALRPGLKADLGLYPIVTLEKQLPNMIGNLV
jgi:N-acyl-D-aspartate/D-glutamate deacylase